MTPPNHPERTFTRKLASHTLAAALGAAVGSLLGFYQGQRSYAQEECVRRGMDARFERDFPYQRWLQIDRPIGDYVAQVRASYELGKPIYSRGLPAVPLELLQQAAERGRQAEQVLERECAENSRKYRY